MNAGDTPQASVDQPSQDTTDGAASVKSLSAEELSIAIYQNYFQFPAHWESWLQNITKSIFAAAFTARLDTYFDAAVRDATLQLEERVRMLCNARADITGVDLIGHAFHPETGFLTDLQAPKAEREGLHQLFRGAVLYIRNPVGHRSRRLDASQAFGAISLVDYLMKTASRAALERLVYPFVPQFRAARIIEGTTWLGSSTDDSSELYFVVLVVESDAVSKKPQLRCIVLHGDPPLEPVSGDLQPIPKETPDGTTALIPQFSLHDLDGDGFPELLVSVTGADGHYFGAILKVAEGTATLYSADQHGEPMETYVHPFDALRPNKLGGRSIVAGYDKAGALAKYWSLSDSGLSSEAAIESF